MKEKVNVLLMKYLLGVATVTALIVLYSCNVFMPNFLVGTWVAPGPNGDEKLVFTEEGDFVAEFYTTDGTAQKISGKYRAGKSAVQLSFKNKDGRVEKRTAAYTMYSRSMDFTIKGKTTRYSRF